MKIKNKAPEYDAQQWTGRNTATVITFLKNMNPRNVPSKINTRMDRKNEKLVIITNKGDIRLMPNDWILVTANGIEAITDAEFNKRFEQV